MFVHPLGIPMAISETATYHEKREWLFAPFGWALFSSLSAIAPLVYWYLGEDHPTVTVLSLALIIAFQFGCVLWGVLRLRRATRGRY
jgi:hypothetical protein